MKNCKQCSVQFEVTDTDRDFYEKINVPEPTLCPDCRQQRRLAFRDERKIYLRKCDATGEEIISIYSPDKPYKVYSTDYWWSDQWDPMEYGRDFDFNRPFFEQFSELSHAVPKLQYSAYGNENCPFMNRCSNCRNCYMCFNLDHGEDSYYSEVGFKLIFCFDCAFSKEMELCSYCTDCQKCYASTNLRRCSNLSESHFCFDCHAGSNLILCWNLRNKNYCIENKEYSKEEFFKKKSELQLDQYSFRQKYEKQLGKYVRGKAIHKYANLLHCENCNGDNIFESKNCQNCYDVLRGEDLTRVISVDNDARDSMDSAFIWDGATLIYESMSASKYHVLFSFNTWESSNITYSELCRSSQNLFGCVGLKHQKYCILNKQYSKEEYNDLVPKVIEHMQKTGEYGEFFPSSLSPFGYNETIAQEYFPLNKEEALQKGFNWSDYEPPPLEVEKTIPAEELPEDIKDVPDDILNWAVKCEISGRPFKIIPQELKFYREHNLPVPRKHPDVRHRERLKLRNPRKLWKRNCQKCDEEIQTTYPPERPEKVYCEECYLKEVY